MNKDLKSFKEFMKKRDKAANDYVIGKAETLGKLVTDVSPATFFGPQGGHKSGAKDVYKKYEGDAAIFNSGSESEFEILQMNASEGIAYWVGFQKAKVFMKGKDEPITMNLRVTEIFRFEDDDWKMVHRHADSLFEEAKKS